MGPANFAKHAGQDKVKPCWVSRSLKHSCVSCCSKGESVCYISLHYLTVETLVHRAFRGISKPQNGFGDPGLGSNTKRCVIKFLECSEQGELVPAGPRRGLHGGGDGGTGVLQVLSGWSESLGDVGGPLAGALEPLGGGAVCPKWLLKGSKGCLHLITKKWRKQNFSCAIPAPGMTFPLLFAQTHAFDSTFGYHLLLEALPGTLGDFALFHPVY